MWQKQRLGPARLRPFPRHDKGTAEIKCHLIPRYRGFPPEASPDAEGELSPKAASDRAITSLGLWRRGMLRSVMALSTRLRRRVNGLLRRITLAGVTFLLLMADGGISGDELQCELAVDRMLTCCPELGTVSLSCVRSGCGGTMVPDLDESRAACLRNASCEQLKAQGVCDPATWETPMTCMPPCMVKVPKCQ